MLIIIDIVKYSINPIYNGALCVVHNIKRQEFLHHLLVSPFGCDLQGSLAVFIAEIHVHHSPAQEVGHSVKVTIAGGCQKSFASIFVVLVNVTIIYSKNVNKRVLNYLHSIDINGNVMLCFGFRFILILALIETFLVKF